MKSCKKEGGAGKRSKRAYIDLAVERRKTRRDRTPSVVARRHQRRWKNQRKEKSRDRREKNGGMKIRDMSEMRAKEVDPVGDCPLNSDS